MVIDSMDGWLSCPSVTSKILCFIVLLVEIIHPPISKTFFIYTNDLLIIIDMLSAFSSQLSMMPMFYLQKSNLSLEN